MAVVGLDLNASSRFVSENDPAGKESPEATVFTLNTLDANLMAHIDDKLTTFAAGEGEDAIANINLNAAAVYAARFAIREWHNFNDIKGDDIPCVLKSTMVSGKKYQAVDRDCINRVPLSILVEIYNKVKSQNNLSEDEGKNSEELSLH